MKLTHTMDLIRPHFNKDETIGAANLAQHEKVKTGVSCEAQPINAFEITENERLNRVVEYHVYTTEDIGAQVRDKIVFTAGNFTGKTLDVTEYRDMAGKGRWFQTEGEDRATGESQL